MTQRIPKTLLEQIQAMAPAHAEVVPLDFLYEDEDYNIAVFVSDDTDRTALQDRLYDLIFDYDDAHDTATLCYVWPKSEWRYIVAA